MKRFFALLLASLLFATVVFCLASCAGSYDISYGELYVCENGGGGKRTLIFNRDGTGVYTVKDTSYKLDVTVDFMWTVSNDDSLYMFDEKVTFKEGSSTYDYNHFCLTDFPCSFSSDVIGFLTGANVLRFIREGSELDGLGSANQRK